MILFKENGNAYVAISTYEFTPYGQMTFGEIPENAPIFKVQNAKALMAICGGNYNAFADALRYEKIKVPKEFGEKEMRDVMLPQCKNLLKNHGLLDGDILSKITTVFGRDGRLFIGIEDNCVFEAGDYYSVSGDDKFEMALLDKTKVLKGEERIKVIYQIRENYFGNRQFPVVYMNTKSCKIHIIHEED